VSVLGDKVAPNTAVMEVKRLLTDLRFRDEFIKLLIDDGGCESISTFADLDLSYLDSHLVQNNLTPLNLRASGKDVAERPDSPYSKPTRAR
jgi:hypothetical protein